MDQDKQKMFEIMGEVAEPSLRGFWWLLGILLLAGIIILVAFLRKQRMAIIPKHEQSPNDLHKNRIMQISPKTQDHSEIYRILSQGMKHALSQLSQENYMSLTNEEVLNTLAQDKALNVDKAKLSGFFSECQNSLYQNQGIPEDRIKISQSLVLEYLEIAQGNAVP